MIWWVAPLHRRNFFQIENYAIFHFTRSDPSLSAGCWHWIESGIKSRLKAARRRWRERAQNPGIKLLFRESGFEICYSTASGPQRSYKNEAMKCVSSANVEISRDILDKALLPPVRRLCLSQLFSSVSDSVCVSGSGSARVSVCRCKGSTPQIHAGGIRALPVRGGGLDPCPDGLGHFFREEFAKIKWAFAWLEGGSKPLPGWFGAQHEFQWGFPNSHGCHNLRSKEVFRCLSKQLYSWVVVETLITTLPCNFLFSSKTQNHRLPQWIFGKLVQQFPHFFWS